MLEIQDILEVENHINDVEAVVFDLDDTLYDEKDYIRSGYRKIAEAFQIAEMEDEMWSVFVNGGKAIDEVLKNHNILNRKKEALYIYRFQNPEICLDAKVVQMLKNIAIEKKIGIITDGRPEGQRAKIKALNLESIISPTAIIITDELGGEKYRKPNKEAFLKISKILNISIEQIAYVGDNIDKDFIAPNQLGMKSIYYRNKNGLYYKEK